MSEFNLSEKIIELKHDTNNCNFLAGEGFLRIEKVKEFIR